MSAVVEVENIPRYFDLQASNRTVECLVLSLQPHNYNHVSHGVQVSSFLKVQWMDPPEMYSGDNQARHMIVELDRSVSNANHCRLM